MADENAHTNVIGRKKKFFLNGSALVLPTKQTTFISQSKTSNFRYSNKLY